MTKPTRKPTDQLKSALDQYDKAQTDLNFLTVSKAFEVLIEHEWRALKKEVEDQGLEAPSPKLAIKQAAKLGLISDPETWLDCLEARNNSVHDYFGISPAEYVSLARKLLPLVQSRKAKAI